MTENMPKNDFPPENSPLERYPIYADMRMDWHKERRFYRLIMMLCLAITLLLIFWHIFFMFLRELPVIRVDSVGNAQLYNFKLNSQRPVPVEAEYFSKEFLKKLIGINSATFRQDLVESLNMMTDEFAEYKRKEYSRELIKQHEQANLLTTLTFSDVKAIFVKDKKHYQVRVEGMAEFDRLVPDMDFAGAPTKYFVAAVQLDLRVRTIDTPQGLLVSDLTIKFHDRLPEKDLKKIEKAKEKERKQ